MRKLLMGIISLGILISCKQPAPIYFNKPMGKPATGFDESLQGVYLDLSDLLERGWMDLSVAMEAEEDSEGLEELGEIIDSLVNVPEAPEKKKKAKDRPDRRLRKGKQDSLTMNLNASIGEIMSDPVSSYTDDAKYSLYALTEDKLQVFVVDSALAYHAITIVELSDTVRLTSDADRYFLNFRSPFGWEIVQIQHMDGYLIFKTAGRSALDDSDAKDAKLGMAAMADYYPKAGAIVNDDGEVIGFRARLRKKTLKDVFDTKEDPWLQLLNLNSLIQME